VCCRALQCVTGYCSVLQDVAGCCRVLQGVAVWCSGIILQFNFSRHADGIWLQCAAEFGNVLRVLKAVAVRCSVLQWY